MFAAVAVVNKTLSKTIGGSLKSLISQDYEVVVGNIFDTSLVATHNELVKLTDSIIGDRVSTLDDGVALLDHEVGLCCHWEQPDKTCIVIHSVEEQTIAGWWSSTKQKISSKVGIVFAVPICDLIMGKCDSFDVIEKIQAQGNAIKKLTTDKTMLERQLFNESQKVILLSQVNKNQLKEIADLKDQISVLESPHTIPIVRTPQLISEIKQFDFSKMKKAAPRPHYRDPHRDELLKRLRQRRNHH